MPFRLYLVPIVGAGTEQDPRRPKYFENGTLIGDQAWTGMDYGFEPWMVVGAALDVSTDNAIVGQADAFALPFDLSVNLSVSQVAAVQAKLEAINVPAGWVTTDLRWIEVARIVLGVFSFLQRLVVAWPGRFFAGLTLGTRFNQLPQAARDALLSTAQSFGLDTAPLTGNSTLRTILKAMADQFGNRRYTFGSTVI